MRKPARRSARVPASARAASRRAATLRRLKRGAKSVRGRGARARRGGWKGGVTGRAKRGRAAAPSLRHRPAARDDTIVELREIACQMHIGVDGEERSTRQQVIVDLRLEGNMAGCDGAFCSALGEEVKRFLGEGRFVLIEATLLKLARLLFRRTRARRVTLRLRKFVLPETDYVAIEMAFRRQEVRPSSSR